MLLENKKNRWPAINRSVHFLKTRRENVALAWIDYKKGYDMVPQTCIIELEIRGIIQKYQQMYQTSDKDINSITEAMKNGKMGLAEGGDPRRDENPKSETNFHHCYLV